MTTLSEAAARVVSSVGEGTVLVGAHDIPAMEERRAAVRSAIAEQEPIERLAAGQAEGAATTARKAEGRHEREARTLAGLRKADEAITARIAGKREEERRDAEAKRRAEREAEAARQRQVEDGLAALGRQEADRLRQERGQRGG